MFGVLGLLPLFPLLLAASGVVVGVVLWVATCEIASIKTTTSTSRTVYVLAAPRVDNDLTFENIFWLLVFFSSKFSLRLPRMQLQQ